MEGLRKYKFNLGLTNETSSSFNGIGMMIWIPGRVSWDPLECYTANEIDFFRDLVKKLPFPKSRDINEKYIPILKQKLKEYER